MDRGKKPAGLIASTNSRMYMDLRDIIREHALRYLPAKALRRCAAVCRDWRLCVASPWFAHNQSLSFRGLSGFFCQYPSGGVGFLSLDPFAYGVPDPSLSFLPEPVDVRCSSNGLLCCQGLTGDKAYYICNPATRTWKKLPPHAADHGPDPAVVLVFEPAVLNFVAEYKLVCAFPSDLDGLEFEIYCSAEGSWRISGEICFGHHSVVPDSGVYAGGVVYWKTNRSGLVAFDLVSERTTFPYPKYSSMGQVNGKLFSADILHSRLSIARLENTYTNTMRMGVKQKAWHVIDIPLAPSSEFRYETASVIFIGHGSVVMQSGESLASYDMKTKEWKLVSEAADYRRRMVPYVNSLVEL